MPEEFPSSVVVFSVDLPGIQKALEEYLAWLKQRSEVLKVVLFGSMATGRHAPGSDVDLLLVLSHSSKPFRDRVMDYLPRTFPVDLDLFPYTEAEATRLGLPQTALQEGTVLWERDSVARGQ